MEGQLFGNAPSYISMTTDVLTLGLSSALVAHLFMGWRIDCGIKKRQYANCH